MNAEPAPTLDLDAYLRRVGIPPSLERRLVHERRGGYCFEQNSLFAAALGALGFRVETLEARVRPADAPAPLPRTHMLLRVTVEGGDVLADVGFGGDGPLVSVPLDGRTVEEQHSIGKRYARHDEVGTPYCLTVDGQTLEDETVTIRYRDDRRQERIKVGEAVEAVRRALRE